MTARAWLIVAAWWIQGAFDRIKRMHLVTDPRCVKHRPPRPGSVLDRASRGLECEPCMVRRAFGLIPDRTTGTVEETK
ncbi:MULTISPECIES: hypothetical protein [unclassified Microbacterium]|uniref:hypothetical protein n=1 Tax=unclassified Microbacterium TaxID=2609290 RepID=UPI003646A8F1